MSYHTRRIILFLLTSRIAGEARKRRGERDQARRERSRRGERDQAMRKGSGVAREIRRGERDQAWREERDAKTRRGERAGEAREIRRVERAEPH